MAYESIKNDNFIKPKNHFFTASLHGGDVDKISLFKEFKIESNILSVKLITYLCDVPFAEYCAACLIMSPNWI